MKIITNGFETNFVVEGPHGAPWITFANSLVTSLEMWDAQAQMLSGRYRILRYDMRGHGRSGVPSPPYGIADLASDAVALWDALGIDLSHWVGLSLGGMVGIHVAALHPARMRTLVASDCRADANEAYANVFVQRIKTTREQVSNTSLASDNGMLPNRSTCRKIILHAAQVKSYAAAVL